MSGASRGCGGGCCGCSAPLPAAAAGAPPRARRCGAASPAPPPAGSRGGPWRASSSTVGAPTAGERGTGSAVPRRGRWGRERLWGAAGARGNRWRPEGPGGGVPGQPRSSSSFPTFLPLYLLPFFPPSLSCSAGTCNRSSPLSGQRRSGAGDPGQQQDAAGARRGGPRRWGQELAAAPRCGSRRGAGLCLPACPAAWCGHSRPSVPQSRRSVLTAARIAPSLLELHQMAAVLNVAVPHPSVVLVTPRIRM